MLLVALQIVLSQVLPTPWQGILGAPSGAVVVWRAEAIRWSPDGARFVPVLADPSAVEAVALDDDGTLYAAVAGGRLGVRTPDGAERWGRISDGFRTRALAVRAGRVVWLGERGEPGCPAPNIEICESFDEFLVSRDGGRTFTARPAWSVGNASAVIALDTRGHMQLVTGWEAGCGGGYQSRFVGTLDGRALADAPWGVDAPVDQIATPDGWTYVPDDCDSADAYGVCAIDPRGAVSRVAGLSAPAWPYLRGAHEGGKTWLLAGGRVAVATGATARVIAEQVPPETDTLAVAAGQVWILAAGVPYRLGADGAWGLVAP